MVYGSEVVQLSELFNGMEGLLFWNHLLQFRGVEKFKVWGEKS